MIGLVHPQRPLSIAARAPRELIPSLSPFRLKFQIECVESLVWLGPWPWVLSKVSLPSINGGREWFLFLYKPI